MGESTWTIRNQATVRADLTRVVEWWLHPDRLADHRAILERRGATEIAVESSESDGRRVRVWTMRYRGTTVEARTETELGPKGPGVAGDDRHVIRAWEHLHVDYPTGRTTTTECETVTELIAVSSDATKITSVHKHHRCDGKWFERFLPPNSERAALNRELRALATQCEMDLSTPSSGV